MEDKLNWFQKFVNWLFRHWAWWQKWFGPGTPDDWRNKFWRYGEAHAVKPVRSAYIFDLRLGFKRAEKWKSYWNSAWKWERDAWWKVHTWRLKWDWGKAPVTQNFWNGIFTINSYLMEDDKGKKHLRIGLVFRPLRDWWLEIGIGRLFDRGEWARKCVIFNWQHNGKIDAEGWNEGSV